MPATAFTMDSISTTILLLLLILTCLFLTRSSRGKSRLPPGPMPLPFLGNLLQFRSKDMMTSLTKLSKKYGPVYTVYLGTRPVVVLSGYQAVKEALVNHGEEFSGRGHYPSFFNFTKGNGIAFSNGERWKVLKKFSLQILRNLGMRKRSNEELILKEVSFLLEELRKTEGEPLNPTLVLSRSVSNIICSVVFGRRFDYDDERLLTIIHFMNDSLEILSSRWSEGTDIITLLNTVHYDPTQFLKPQEFNPQHFLDASQSFKKSPAFMPFSAGPRLCLGESLARMELFLYLSAILQNFSLQPLGAPEDIDLTPRTSGLGNLPRPYELCMRAR